MVILYTIFLYFSRGLRKILQIFFFRHVRTVYDRRVFLISYPVVTYAQRLEFSRFFAVIFLIEGKRGHGRRQLGFVRYDGHILNGDTAEILAYLIFQRLKPVGYRLDGNTEFDSLAEFERIQVILGPEAFLYAANIL